ncbi:hypothetical protein AKI39_21250 [Bordetella sp. H567]|uniref:hypothetical protein n=1 Tax=Bordetella sp. H567 TaxID=1697043 RepID=UPI00081CF9EC|nr:hypothetical protein [Bordetella sp. H567]AOB32725.1 hypothetical protein AKI39_21250 [Bordetella sp. H567]
MNKRPTSHPADLPAAGAGAHEKAPDEKIKSRSADPGQSSYGGFKGEDPRRQSEDLSGGDRTRDKPAG